MILKEGQGTGGPALARYLVEGKNEKYEIVELRNIRAPSLKAALFDMDMVASGSRAQKHIFHINMRAAPGESLSPEQWKRAAAMCAEALKMENHQSALVLHENPDGTTHAHFVINRVHPQTLIAADLWHCNMKLNEVRQEIEREFNLQPIPERKKAKTRDNSLAAEPENQQARVIGENASAIRDRIKLAMERSDSGVAFRFALLEEGLVLAKGDQRDFVAVSPELGVYTIGKRTTGLSAEQVRDRLADLDPDSLPSVDDAKNLQAYLNVYGEELEQKDDKEKEKKGRGEAESENAPSFKRWRGFKQRLREDLVNMLHGAPIGSATRDAADARKQDGSEDPQRRYYESLLNAQRRSYSAPSVASDGEVNPSFEPDLVPDYELDSGPARPSQVLESLAPGVVESSFMDRYRERMKQQEENLSPEQRAAMAERDALLKNAFRSSAERNQEPEQGREIERLFKPKKPDFD